MLQRIISSIDNINYVIGRCVAWLALAMVLLMFFNVVGRYMFNANPIWEQDLIRFVHAILFLTAAGYTLLTEKHVRVDVLYHHFNVYIKAIINLIGVVVFLFPTCFAVIYFSYDFIVESWAIHESSSEYNGLPGVFLLKSFVWVFAGTLAIQGIATILKSIDVIKRTRSIWK